VNVTSGVRGIESARIGIAENAELRRFYLDAADLERLGRFGDVDMEEYDVALDHDPRSGPVTSR
jgi:hypothetical protein